MKIGFIGQGFVGKAYADDFENRGFSVVRYSNEPEFSANKKVIGDCDIVFIAVPTPTTKDGFDDSVVREVVTLVGEGKTAVIKSTMLPGTVESIQKENSNIYVMHSPEFLTAAVADNDARFPKRNIVGIPVQNKEYKKKAEEVLKIMPKAPFTLICTSREAEMIKYINNTFLYVKNLQMSVCYELAEKLGCDLDVLHKAALAEPMLGTHHHLAPTHKGGYGAGGECLLKDFESFLQVYKKEVNNKIGINMLEAIRDRNIALLTRDNKDIEILKSIYGEDVIKDNS